MTLLDIPRDGIVNEMKLSNQLLDELETIRRDATDLRDRVGSSEVERQSIQRDYYKLAEHLKVVDLELRMTRFAERAVRQRAEDAESERDNLRQQLSESNLRKQEAQQEINNLKRSVCQKELQSDQLSRMNASLQSASNLSSLELQVLSEQVRSMHAAAKDLHTTKILEDSLEYQKELFAHRLSEVLDYKEALEIQVAKLQDQKQSLRAETHNALDEKAQKEEELQSMLDNHRLEKSRWIEVNDKLGLDLSFQTGLAEGLKAQVATLTDERTKLRESLKKYRFRRKMYYEQEQKICKKCGREYIEKENFNWSCRTHHSKYSDQANIYFCCGKVGREAPGCRFAKHESKEDDEELDEEERRKEKEREQRIKNQNVCCYCCKETGHTASECTRDPNHRSKRTDNKIIHIQAEREAHRIIQLETSVVGNRRIRGGVSMLQKVWGVMGWRPFTKIMERQSGGIHAFVNPLEETEIMMDELKQLLQRTAKGGFIDMSDDGGGVFTTDWSDDATRKAQAEKAEHARREAEMSAGVEDVQAVTTLPQNDELLANVQGMEDTYILEEEAQKLKQLHAKLDEFEGGIAKESEQNPLSAAKLIGVSGASNGVNSGYVSYQDEFLEVDEESAAFKHAQLVKEIHKSNNQHSSHKNNLQKKLETSSDIIITKIDMGSSTVVPISETRISGNELNESPTISSVATDSRFQGAKLNPVDRAAVVSSNELSERIDDPKKKKPVNQYNRGTNENGQLLRLTRK